MTHIHAGVNTNILTKLIKICILWLDNGSNGYHYILSYNQPWWCALLKTAIFHPFIRLSTKTAHVFLQQGVGDAHSLLILQKQHIIFKPDCFIKLMLLSVRVCTGFCYLFRTFSGINTDRMTIHSPHEEQRPVLMRHDLISKVMVEFRGKVWIEFRLRLG